MTIKERIIKWLGFAELEARFQEIDRLVAQARTAHVKPMDFQAEEHGRQLVAMEAKIKADAQSRDGLILEAAMNAADKIARAVAQRGDSNLKEYVDAQLDAFQSAVQWHN